jgi:hypothetical protein
MEIPAPENTHCLLATIQFHISAQLYGKHSIAILSRASRRPPAPILAVIRSAIVMVGLPSMVGDKKCPRKLPAE